MKGSTPPRQKGDIIKGHEFQDAIIAAEESAIAQFRKIIDLASRFDPATENLAITAVVDEEEHRRELKGFLKEVEAGRLV